MAHSGAPSVVNANQPAPKKPTKPVRGEVRTFNDNEGNPSFEVEFKKDTVVIRKTGNADILRTIVPKYGNIRRVDGQMKDVADQTLWYLFNLQDDV